MTTWTNFLQSNFASDEDRETLRRVMGLTLTGNGRGTAVLLHGPAMSGKTTLINLIRAMLPDERVTTIDRAPSYDSNVDFSKTWMVAWELPGRPRNRDYVWIKFSNGNDPMMARRVYDKKYFTYYPDYAVWMATHHTVYWSDVSTWRRITPIAMVAPPFPERDLLVRLLDCTNEIRAWAVKGLVSPPPRPAPTKAAPVVRDDLGALTTALADELNLRDRLVTAGQALAAGRPAAWAELMAELGHREPLFSAAQTGPVIDYLATLPTDPDARTHVGELYAAYRAWCDGIGRPPVSSREFGRRLDLLGYAYELTDDTVIGLSLATAQPGLAAEIGGVL